MKRNQHSRLSHREFSRRRFIASAGLVRPNFEGLGSPTYLSLPYRRAGILCAQFSRDVGGNISSKATGKWYR